MHIIKSNDFSWRPTACFPQWTRLNRSEGWGKGQTKMNRSEGSGPRAHVEDKTNKHSLDEGRLSEGSQEGKFEQIQFCSHGTSQHPPPPPPPTAWLRLRMLNMPHPLQGRIQDFRRRGRQHIIFTKFSENYMKLGKFSTVGGGAFRGRPPLDPPLSLAFIALSAAQSSAQTRIHSAIVVIDTSNNAWHSQVHWLVGTPYLAIKASNDPI